MIICVIGEGGRLFALLGRGDDYWLERRADIGLGSRWVPPLHPSTVIQYRGTPHPKNRNKDWKTPVPCCF